MGRDKEDKERRRQERKERKKEKKHHKRRRNDGDSSDDEASSEGGRKRHKHKHRHRHQKEREDRPEGRARKAEDHQKTYIDFVACRQHLTALRMLECASQDILGLLEKVDEGERLNLTNMANEAVRGKLEELFKCLHLANKKPHVFVLPAHADALGCTFQSIVDKQLKIVNDQLGEYVFSQPPPQAQPSKARPAPQPASRTLGPRLPPPSNGNGEEEEGSGDEQAAKANEGPGTPPPPGEEEGGAGEGEEEEEEEVMDEDEGDGPLPFQGSDRELRDIERQQIDEQFKLMEDQRALGGAKKELKREEWMTALPSFGSVNVMDQKHRGFRKTAGSAQDLSWAMSPQEKAEAEAKKAREKQMGRPAPVVSAKPKQEHVVVKRSGKTLLEQHMQNQRLAEKAAKAKGGEEGGQEATHPWKPFDRDQDLKVNQRVSRGQLNDMLKRAAELNSRFARGS